MWQSFPSSFALILVVLLFGVVEKEALAGDGPVRVELRSNSNNNNFERCFLCEMLDRLENEPGVLAQEFHDWSKEHGLLVDFRDDSGKTAKKDVDNDDKKSSQSAASHSSKHASQQQRQQHQLPVVFAHGMGDSCFNGGMQHIVNHTSTNLLDGVYTTCIATGKNQQEDTTNGYLLNMNANVDIFAQAVQSDPKLQNGFHGIGFSQGCNVLRGYITRYNNPPVHSFIAVNGVNAGEGAVPNCFPKSQHASNNNNKDMHQPLSSSSSSTSLSTKENYLGGICDLLLEQASKRAYTEYYQKHSFQANYWRDSRQKYQPLYKQYSQLADWNNENNITQSYKDNWSKTSKFIWVMATADSMVWPKEGEHWGTSDPNDRLNILPMNQTEWYIKDLFGLKTAQDAGKNYFETFQGDHLQFEMEQFDYWVKTYMKGEKNNQYNNNNMDNPTHNKMEFVAEEEALSRTT